MSQSFCYLNDCKFIKSTALLYHAYNHLLLKLKKKLDNILRVQVDETLKV